MVDYKFIGLPWTQKLCSYKYPIVRLLAEHQVYQLYKSLHVYQLYIKQDFFWTLVGHECHKKSKQNKT